MAANTHTHINLFQQSQENYTYNQHYVGFKAFECVSIEKWHSNTKEKRKIMIFFKVAWKHAYMLWFLWCDTNKCK